MGFKCYICKSYDPRRQSLYRIPHRNEENSKRWRLWLKILEENELNLDKIRICSDHFIRKEPAKKDDYLNVDWAPNQNLGRFSKNKNMWKYFLQCENSNPSPPVKITPNVDQRDQPTSTDNRYQKNPALKPTSTDNRYKKNPALKPTSNNNRYQENLSQKDGSSSHAHQSLITVFSGSSQIPEKASGKNIVTSTSLLPVKKRRIQIIEQKLFFPMEVQTELSIADINNLFQYCQELADDRNKLLLQISNLTYDYEYFKGNDKKTLFYTGLPTWKLLNHLFKWVEPFLPEHGNAKLSPFQMFVLTLMKLRLNLLFTDLAYRFQIQVSTASNYFHRCVYILYKKFFGSKLIYWPNDQYLIVNTPSYFRSNLKDLVTVVIDCFEIFIERSAVLRALAQSWSTYKHHVTIKFLIGISMSGAIIFISPAFGGRASDKEITLKSGILGYLRENNLVLADKGFLVDKEVKETGASLRMPCFVKNVTQLDPKDVEHTRETANLRIHVERLISVLRQKFNICSDLAPMTAISKKNDLYDHDLYDKIVYICCCLVNLCPPTIINNFEM